MGQFAHKTKSSRRLITIQEWAHFIGVARPKVYELLVQYQSDGREYDPRDVYSVLDFHGFVIMSQMFNNKILQGFVNRN